MKGNHKDSTLLDMALVLDMVLGTDRDIRRSLGIPTLLLPFHLVNLPQTELHHILHNHSHSDHDARHDVPRDARHDGRRDARHDVRRDARHGVRRDVRRDARHDDHRTCLHSSYYSTPL
jgi:hypothetical protein